MRVVIVSSYSFPWAFWCSVSLPSHSPSKRCATPCASASNHDLVVIDACGG